MTSSFLIPDLEHDEGLRLAAYQDSVGVWTIGYGHAHIQPGVIWTLAEAQAQLQADEHSAETDLDRELPWWRGLNDMRQDCLANQCFNMGIESLLTFNTYLGLVKAGNYEAAAYDELHTKWAKQVGARASRLAAQMYYGTHQVDGARPPLQQPIAVAAPVVTTTTVVTTPSPSIIQPIPVPAAPVPAPVPVVVTYSNWENTLHVLIAAVIPVFGSLFVLLLRFLKTRQAQARAAPPSA